MQLTGFVAVLCVAASLVGAVELQESFSGTVFPPEMWTVRNADGGVRSWLRSVVKSRTAPACAAVISESRTLRNEDWLITRRVFPVPGSNVLGYWVRSHTSSKAESLEVRLSTTGRRIEDFAHVLAAFSTKENAYFRRTVSLSAFDSMPVYVAFRYLSKGKRALYLDDVVGLKYIPADVGVAAVTAPRRYELPDTSITPVATIKNYGSNAQTGFAVRMVITNVETGDTAYQATATAGAIQPQQTASVAFASTWQTAVGRYLVLTWTQLLGDQEPRNDSLVFQCEVAEGEIHDVAANAILRPGGLIPPGPVTPRVEIENLGNVGETFPVYFTVRRSGSLVYRDSVDVTLAANALDTVDFLSWNAQSGLYTLEAFTRLAGDRDPANDSQFGTVEVVTFIHDVGVEMILAPVDTVVQGSSVIPQAVVLNYGDYAETFDVVMRIGAGYVDTVRQNLLPGATDTAEFDNWVATTPGLLPVVSFTLLLGDEDPANDTAAATIYVEPLQGQAEEGRKPQAASLKLQTIGTRRVNIAFTAPAGAGVQLGIYDACGNLVGHHHVLGSGSSEEFVWAGPSSGVYILMANVAGRSFARKLVLY